MSYRVCQRCAMLYVDEPWRAGCRRCGSTVVDASTVDTQHCVYDALQRAAADGWRGNVRYTASGRRSTAL